VACGAGPRLDDELLAEMPRQIVREHAPDDVRCAARRLADDDLHGAVRIGALRQNDGRRGWKQRRGARELDETAARMTHGILQDLFLSLINSLCRCAIPPRPARCRAAPA